MALKKDTLLWRVPNLTLELRQNRLKVKHGTKNYFVSQYCLAILDVFAIPKTFEQGVADLAGRIKGNSAWLEATSHIMDLYKLGILESGSGMVSELGSEAGRFDSAEVHIRMLNDTRRTQAFMEALAETVQPGDVVLDIGTGTGVLAMMAARSGARMIYAVEREPNMASLAEQLFEKNRLHDRIRIIRGKSAEIELPEKADVLVAEIVGNDPLAEGILPATNDALQRLLKPEARLIPGRLKIYALPLTVPKSFLEQYLFKEAQVNKWMELYGISFSHLTEVSRKQSFHALVNTYKARAWKRLSDPVLVADIHLNQEQSHFINSDTYFEVRQSGFVSGVLVFFELILSPSVAFSIHPDQAEPSNSWSSRLCIPGTPVFLKKGKLAQLCYSYSDQNKSQATVRV